MAFPDPLLRARRTESLFDSSVSDTQREALTAWYGVLKSKNSFEPSDYSDELFGGAFSCTLRLSVIQDEDGWPSDYRHMSHGSEVADFFGPLEDTLVSEAYADLYRFSVEPFYAEVVSVKAPALRHFTSDTDSGEMMTFSELVLPVEAQDGDILELLVIFSFGEADASKTGRLTLRAR